jgi:MazG family protein
MELPAGFEGLVAIMDRLRGPDGCPWDREQDYHTLRGYLLEECHEVAEALDAEDHGALCEELGDLLFQIVFLSRIAKEESRFTVDDVIRGIKDKMIRRHPHVFGDAQVGSAEEQRLAWERHKAQERRAKAAHGVLDGVARALPALMRAEKLQRRAAKVGFDWSDAGGALAKVAEESREVEQEMQAGAPDPRRLADEVGDLLFACVNLARLLGVDAESALSGANHKFERRFRAMEAALAAQDRTPGEAGLEEMDALWEQAKRRERSGR